MHQLCAEGCSHTDGLRIDGVTTLTNTMAGLAPPVVGRNAQTVDRHRLVHHQSHLLLGGEQRDEILNALSKRKVGVLERIHLSVWSNLLDTPIDLCLDGQGAQCGTILVEQLNASVFLGNASILITWSLVGREDNHHLCLLAGLDGFVRIDGLNTIATGDAFGNDYGSLRLVLQSEGMADGSQRTIHLTEIPLVGIERHGALLLRRQCSHCQQRTNSDNN